MMVPGVRLSVDISVRSLAGGRGLSRRVLARAVAAALDELPPRRYVLEIVYASDADMRRLNSRYGRGSAVTDVLAFPAFQEMPCGALLLGEVIVNRREAKRRAAEGGGATAELLRYIVHGVLHIAGYDDASPELKQRMWRKQERIVAAIRRKDRERNA